MKPWWCRRVQSLKILRVTSRLAQYLYSEKQHLDLNEPKESNDYFTEHFVHHYNYHTKHHLTLNNKWVAIILKMVTEPIEKGKVFFYSNTAVVQLPQKSGISLKLNSHFFSIQPRAVFFKCIMGTQIIQVSFITRGVNRKKSRNWTIIRWIVNSQIRGSCYSSKLINVCCYSKLTLVLVIKLLLPFCTIAYTTNNVIESFDRNS